MSTKTIKIKNTQVRTLFDEVKASCGLPLVKYLQFKSVKGEIVTFAFTNHAPEDMVSFITLKFDLPSNSYGHI